MELHKRKTKSITRKCKLRIKTRLSPMTIISVQGTVKIKLPIIVQKYIGCRIGEDITSDYPWIFVQKEKICDHMDLHDNSSEFLPIKQQILPYPEEKILIGSYGIAAKDEDEFIICLTVEAKNNIIKMDQEKKEMIHQRLLDSTNMKPRKWCSNGSEIEMEDNFQLNFRSHLTVQIKFTPVIIKRKMDYRFAEDVIDGYVCFQPKLFDSILRKRVHRAVQVTPLNESKVCQTNETSIPVNKCTQYHFKYKDFNLSENAIHAMAVALQGQFNEILELTHFNEHIDLYIDDFITLPGRYKPRFLNPPTCVLNFKDVFNCVGFKVSDVALNKLISGTFAASYARDTKFTRYAYYNPHDEVNDITFDDHLVIIWTFEDSVRPKLYLHAHRDVTNISFCPYNENILVGGCTNGQIIIWDLTNKIQQDESRLILSTKELKNRDILIEFMKWMKYPPGTKHVFPTIVSQLDYSHKSNISQIQWIPMNHHITKNGRIEENKEEKHMQFCTCATDDINVLIWDIMFNKNKIATMKKNKANSEKPQGLLIGVSPLKALHDTFIPQFAFLIQDPLRKPFIPVLNLIMSNQKYSYITKNPETLSNYAQKTLFNVYGLSGPMEEDRHFFLTTLEGNIIRCDWQGNDFDQGLFINSEICNMVKYKCVHDGPINTCQPNSSDPTILLTVGGTIFAIWDTSSTKLEPVLWRRGHMRYLSGIWSTQNPSGMILIRKDSTVEFWSLIDDSKGPIKVRRRFIGLDLTALYGSAYNIHVRKGTFTLTDFTGNIAVFATKTSIFETRQDLKINFKEHLHAIGTSKKSFQYWCDYIHKKDNLALFKIKESEISPVPIRKTTIITGNATSKMKLMDQKTKQKVSIESEMYKTLLQKKKLNLDEIQRNKIALQSILRDESLRSEKLKQRIAKKEQIYKIIAKSFLPEKKKIPQKKFLSINITKDIAEIMKEEYMQDYYNIEHKMLHFIKTHHFHFTFEWEAMMQQAGKRKYILSSLELNKRVCSYVSLNQADLDAEITAEVEQLCTKKKKDYENVYKF